MKAGLRKETEVVILEVSIESYKSDNEWKVQRRTQEIETTW